MPIPIAIMRITTAMETPIVIPKTTKRENSVRSISM